MPIVENRDDLGLRAPREVSKDIHPERGGVAVHWAGPAQNLGGHVQCQSRWRQWQIEHMDGKGWVDIAYNWGACDHGHLLTGRGWGVRSAANGSDDANDRFLAVCWLGGQGESPTALALHAIGWIIAYCRGRGAGPQVLPHKAFYSTACPGPVLEAHCRAWTRDAVTSAPLFPLGWGHYFGPPGDARAHPGPEPKLAIWQDRVGITPDGYYGPVTRAAAIDLQRQYDLAMDGLIGPLTWAAAWRE